MANNVIISTIERIEGMADYKRSERKVSYDINYVKEHYDVFNLKMPMGMKDKLKAKASEQGLSVNKYLVALIDNELNK